MEFLRRAYVIVPLSIGVLLAWIFSAIVLFKFSYTPFFESLLLLYGVCAWDLRKWNRFKFRLPKSIFVSGIILFTLGILEPPCSISRHFHDLPYCIYADTCELPCLLLGLLLVSLVVFATACFTPFRKNDNVPDKTRDSNSQDQSR